MKLSANQLQSRYCKDASQCAGAASALSPDQSSNYVAQCTNPYINVDNGETRCCVEDQLCETSSCPGNNLGDNLATPGVSAGQVHAALTTCPSPSTQSASMMLPAARIACVKVLIPCDSAGNSLSFKVCDALAHQVARQPPAGLEVCE
ncbi:hypothetical protein V8C86DRAFT_2437494 [Haematococcus lacustris]